MSEALGTGWLVALIVAFGPTLLGALVFFGRYVARKWSAPLEAERRENAALAARVEELSEENAAKTNALTRAEVREMFYEQRIRECEKELENWRAGRYRSAQ